LAKHPYNGPTFSKPTVKMPRPAVPSPGRIQAEEEQMARDAAKSRRLHKLLHGDMRAFLSELGLIPKGK
jgi:hypothetical protein